MTMFDNEKWALELDYAPTRYAPFRPNQSGRWYVMSYQGQPMGVVWHDDEEGSGFLQADEDLVPGTSVLGASLLNTFAIMKKQGLSAATAFNMLRSIPGVAVLDENEGKLSQAMTVAHSLQTAAVTAAAVASTQSPSVVAVFNPDSEQFLECVRSDASGVYLRDNGEWHRLPDEDDSLDMTEWIWIDADGLAHYDSLAADGKAPTRDEMLTYQISN